MRPDSACPETRILRLLINGELPLAEAEPLALHIERCSHCARLLDNLQADGPFAEALRAQATICLPPPSPTVDCLIDRLGKLAGPPEPFPALRRGDTSFLAPALLPDEIGRLAHYRVLQLLGEGGMGMVFRAEDPSLERAVALKVLHPELARRADFRLRFLHEARATAALRHDRIVVIHQVGEDRGVPFLTMELLEGENLRNWLARHRRPPLAYVLEVGRAVASGLAAAHARGLIHCDVKPANLWLEKPSENGDGAGAKVGRVKLLDFGIARTADADSTGTDFGLVLGTPDYMAPERLCGAVLDGRCDLYSLGCVLYEMCSGRTPFGGGAKEEVLTRVLHDQPRRLRDENPTIPSALAELIHQLLAKAPQDRPASAGDVERSFVALSQADGAASNSLHSPRAMRHAPLFRWTAGVGAAIALFLAVAVWLMRGSDPMPPAIAPPPGPVGGAWLDYVRALTAEQRMEAVAAKLAELNPDFSGKIDYFRVENGVVADLRFLTDGVEDVTPLRALPSLRMLDCRGSLPGKGRLADLAPLTGMTLEALWCSNNPIADLSPLHAGRATAKNGRTAWERGIPLVQLHASHTALTTLTELRNMSLRLLVISGTAVRDLEPLRGMPLLVLHCEDCPIVDLSPLQQTELRVLHADIDPRRDRVPLSRVSSLQEINHRRPKEYWRSLQ